MWILNIIFVIAAGFAVWIAFEFGRVNGGVETLMFVHALDTDVYDGVRKVLTKLRDIWYTGVDRIRCEWILDWTEMAVNKYNQRFEK